MTNKDVLMSAEPWRARADESGSDRMPWELLAIICSGDPRTIRSRLISTMSTEGRPTRMWQCPGDHGWSKGTKCRGRHGGRGATDQELLDMFRRIEKLPNEKKRSVNDFLEAYLFRERVREGIA